MKVQLLALVVMLALMNGCGPGRLITPVVTDRSTDMVVSSMYDHHARFDFFAARFSGKASWDDTMLDIAGNIRIRKDSAIFISVAPVLGIEVARILITPNDVKVLNRLESTYFEGDMGLINNMINADLDYFMLQDMLTGNDFSHFTRNNFRLSDDPQVLLLHSPGRSRAKPASRANGSIEQNIWLDKITYRLVQTNIFERAANRSIQAKYNNHTTVQGQLIPSEILLVFIDPANRAELTINYSRITLNQPQQITFSIPSRYQPADF